MVRTASDRIQKMPETGGADLSNWNKSPPDFARTLLTELTLDPPTRAISRYPHWTRLSVHTIHLPRARREVRYCSTSSMAACPPILDRHSRDRGGTATVVVAMTRAKDDLRLVVPQRFFVHRQHAHGDRHLYAARTRFIPEKLLVLFEQTAWPVVLVGSATRPASQGPKVDISARMRGMWR